MSGMPRLSESATAFSQRLESKSKTYDSTDIVHVSSGPISTKDSNNMITFIRIAHRVILIRQFTLFQFYSVAIKIPYSYGMISRSGSENVGHTWTYSERLDLLFSLALPGLHGNDDHSHLHDLSGCG